MNCLITNYYILVNKGATIYRVKCYVIERPFFYMGQPKEAKIVERMCKYIINGITGYGISEWEYGLVECHGFGVLFEFQNNLSILDRIYVWLLSKDFCNFLHETIYCLATEKVKFQNFITWLNID